MMCAPYTVILVKRSRTSFYRTTNAMYALPLFPPPPPHSFPYRPPPSGMYQDGGAAGPFGVGGGGVVRGHSLHLLEHVQSVLRLDGVPGDLISGLFAPAYRSTRAFVVLVQGRISDSSTYVVRTSNIHAQYFVCFEGAAVSFLRALCPFFVFDTFFFCPTFSGFSPSSHAQTQECKPKNVTCPARGTYLLVGFFTYAYLPYF